MKLFQKVFRNSGAILAGNGIDALAGFWIFILLARYYGQADFGKISFFGAFFFLLGVVDSLWLRPILMREMAKDPERAGILVANGVIIRCFLSAFTLLFFGATIYWIGIPQDMVLLAWLSAFNIILTPFLFAFEIIFRSCLSMEYLVRIKLIGNSLFIIFIYSIISFKWSILYFFVGSIVFNIFFFFINQYYAGKLIQMRFTPDLLLWRKVFAQGWFLGLSAVFIFIYHRLDQIMIFHMQGAALTGLYAAGVRLVESLQVVPLALMASLLPVLSRARESDPDLFEKTYRLGFKYLLMFIVPVAVGGALFSHSILDFFYGHEFIGAGASFSILIVAEVFVFLGIVNNTVLVAANQQAWDPVFTGTSVVVNIVLNFLLIPKFGLAGAAVASLVAYATGPVMGLLIPATKAYSLSMVHYSVKPLGASLAMLAVYYFFRPGFGLAIVVLPAMYMISLYFLHSFDKDDVYFLRSVFGLEDVR